MYSHMYSTCVQNKRTTSTFKVHIDFERKYLCLKGCLNSIFIVKIRGFSNEQATASKDSLYTS